jgi:TonB family protein
VTGKKMKQTFSILLLLFLLAKSYAQDTIYLKNVNDTVAIQKEKAIYYRVTDNKVNPIEVVTFYMNGVKVSKALYSSLKPEIREGEYESFFYNGKTNIKGTFKDNKMEGAWIAYNKEKNFLETKTTYKDNLKSGRSYIFYETGKLKRMDIYVRDTLGLSTCYDSVGNVINCAMQVEPIENLVDTFGIFTKVDTMPKFPGGVPELMTFLFKNLNYPKVAREKNLEGKVITKFYIDIDGTVKNPIVVKDGVGGGCAEEAIRVIKKMPKWLPGIINGKKVKVYYTLPISFKLS